MDRTAPTTDERGFVGASIGLGAPMNAGSEATAERISLLHEAAARARPVALAREHVLPVLEPLQPLLPEGLRRGSTVAVGDSTSLALALLAGPSGNGSWAAAVGVSNLGLAAAAELGVALDRLVVVADPPSESWATVVATLVDALDVVLLRARRRVSGGDARRLIARGPRARRRCSFCSATRGPKRPTCG